MSEEKTTPPRAERFFQNLADFLWKAVSRPLPVLAAAVFLTAAGGSLAGRLSIDTDLANLLPPDHPSVRSIEELRETVGGETTAAVILECPETDVLHAFAEELIPRLEAMRPPGGGELFFSAVDYRRDVEFLENNGLYLATEAELDIVEEFLLDEIEAARMEANPLLVDLLEEEEEDPEKGPELARVKSELLVREYPLSEDGRTMVLNLTVTGSKTDLGFIDRLYAALGKEVADLNPKRFHPELNVELGGPLLRHSMELHAIGDDVLNSVGTGIALVLLMVAVYFISRAWRIRAGTAPPSRIVASELLRTPLALIIIGLPLGMSLTWTFGITYLRFGTLNLMTSTLALVLFGLGIDFSIHIYARYTEERGLGRGVDEAMHRTLRANIRPITISAATTAAAFAILTLADFRGFSEFGFIAASGILFALVAMFTVLPALVVVLERSGLMHLRAAGPLPEFAGSGRRLPFRTLGTSASFILMGAALFLVPQIHYEWDFDRLEPDYPAYEEILAKYRRVHPPTGRNPAYVVAATPEEVPEIVSAVKGKADKDLESPTVKRVESLQERFPLSQEAQEAKLRRLAAIRLLLDNKYLRRAESDDLDILRKAAGVVEPIPLERLPRSLRRSFTSKDGRVGNFVIIYPSVGLSDGRNSMAFADDVGRIETENGKVYYAASTSIVAAEMLRLMRAESPVMVLLVAACLLVLIPLAFRRLDLSLLALTPLAIGIVWMLTVASAWRMSLNFYNLVVFPAVLGMGADAGVHLVHRWTEEGRGSVTRVLGTTGEAVTMCTVTTMLGFSGMTTSFHPGLRSMGWLAVAGLGSVLAVSLVLLPVVLQFIDDRRGRLASSVGGRD